MCSHMLLVFLFAFFLTSHIFTLLATSISHFLTAGVKFSCCSPNEISHLCFSLSLCLFFSLSFADNTLENPDIEIISVFHFVFIDSFIVSPQLQDTVGHAISRQKISSCNWVALPVDWACGTDGRSLARCTVTWLPNFLGWIDYQISLAMELRYEEGYKI